MSDRNRIRRPKACSPTPHMVEVCRTLLRVPNPPTRDVFLTDYRNLTGDKDRSEQGVMTVARNAIFPDRLPQGYSVRDPAKYGTTVPRKTWEAAENEALLLAYNCVTDGGANQLVSLYREAMPESMRTDGAIKEQMILLRHHYHLPTKHGFHKLPFETQNQPSGSVLTRPVPANVAPTLPAHAPTMPAPTMPAPPPSRPPASVEKLYQAFQDGVITEAEFLAKVKGR